MIKIFEEEKDNKIYSGFGNDILRDFWATVSFFTIYEKKLSFLEFKTFSIGISGKILESEFLKLIKGVEVLGKEKFGVEKILKWKLLVMKWVFSLIPFCRQVYICNNYAFGCADEKSDIDVLVVVKSGRIFFVKFVATCLFQLFGLRRHGEKISGRVCLSFFVNEECLSFEDFRIKPLDIYLSFWLISLVPLWESDLNYKILMENKWIFDVFPKKKLRNPLFVKNFGFEIVKGIFESILSGKIGNLLENYLKMRSQLRFERMKGLNLNACLGVEVSERRLKYHLKDRRKEILDKFLKIFVDFS